MSDIEKIIEKHKANLLELLPGGGHFRSNQHVASALEAAVREAVEAERGRIALMIDGMLVKNPSPRNGEVFNAALRQAANAVRGITPTTDSEGAG